MKRRNAGPNLTHQSAVRRRCGKERGNVPATLTRLDDKDFETTITPTIERAVMIDGPGEVGIIRSKITPHFAPHDNTKDKGKQHVNTAIGSLH